MTPEQISQSQTEHAHQAAFFCAMREYHSRYPQLQFMHAIPNGGQRNAATSARLKAEGVKPGVPDVCLPFPSKGFHAMYIEFKRPKGPAKAAGKLSAEQKLWAEYLSSQNYFHVVVDNYLSATQFVLQYLTA